MKKKLFALLFGASLVFALAACGGGGNQSKSSDNGSSGDTTAVAESVIKSTCSACHGQDLKGAVGPDISKIGSQLSKDDIVNIVKNGKGQMPAQSQLSDAQVNAVATYLASKK